MKRVENLRFSDRTEEPIGGGGGLPEPKNRAKYGKLPFLTRRQTYKFVNAIPIIQLFICFILFLGVTSNWYEVSYQHLLQIVGFSLITGLYQWYASGIMGSCGGVVISVYTLITLNLLNIVYLFFEFKHYELYGLIVIIVGVVLTIYYYKK